ncbi:DUF2945 domain-containing protein [Streptomyces sp. B21-083]
MTEKTPERGNHEVDASPEDPRYQVRSAKPGKAAVHKPPAPRRR